MSERSATVAATKGALTARQQQFLELLQDIRFGRIERLTIVDGEPQLRGMRWRRKVLVAGANGPHPAAGKEDFRLKRSAEEFFRLLRQMQAGQITNLEVRDGLPCSYEVEESLAD